MVPWLVHWWDQRWVQRLVHWWDQRWVQSLGHWWGQQLVLVWVLQLVLRLVQL